MYEKTILENMKKRNNKKQKGSPLIKTLHEKWVIKNGYRNNDRLNSKNTPGFKDGTER